VTYTRGGRFSAAPLVLPFPLLVPPPTTTTPPLVRVPEPPPLPPPPLKFAVSARIEGTADNVSVAASSRARRRGPGTALGSWVSMSRASWVVS
jgi:hypothetical protein